MSVAEYPIIVGGDFNIIPDAEESKNYCGATTSVGIGTPGADLHIGGGYTGTVSWTKHNIFEVWTSVYDSIMEW